MRMKFGKVVGLFTQVDRPDCTFVACQTFRTIRYDEWYEAFEVKLEVNHYLVYKLQDLKLFKTFTLHKNPSRSGTNLIVTKENYKRDILANRLNTA